MQMIFHIILATVYHKSNDLFVAEEGREWQDAAGKKLIRAEALWQDASVKKLIRTEALWMKPTDGCLYQYKGAK